MPHTSYEARVLKAARALSDASAKACNVDAEDNWKTYSQVFIEDARAALDAAGIADLESRLSALRKDAERAHEALKLAQARVLEDRTTLWRCHVSPKTGTVDDERGREGLREYDHVLRAIDAARSALSATQGTAGETE